MSRRISSVVLMMLVCCQIASGYSLIADQASDEKREFVTFALQFADATEVLQQLVPLLNSDVPVAVEFSVMDKANMIVARGTAEELDKVQKYIAEFDIESARDSKFEVLKIENGSAGSKAAVLRDVLTNNADLRVRVAYDEQSRSVILTGSPADISVVKALVKKLDWPSEPATEAPQQKRSNCSVRITWLVNSTKLDPADSVEQPNATLRALVDALENQESLTSAMTLTKNQTMVQVVQERGYRSKFENTSVTSGGKVSMVVEGELWQNAENNFGLAIALRLQLPARNQDLSINTTLTLPKNHPVAFSISDVGPYPSVAVVEILDEIR